jgi:hypothetical protein
MSSPITKQAKQAVQAVQAVQAKNTKNPKKQKTSETNFSKEDLLAFFRTCAESPDQWAKHVSSTLTTQQLPLAITLKFFYRDGELKQAHMTVGTNVIGMEPLPLAPDSPETGITLDQVMRELAHFLCLPFSPDIASHFTGIIIGNVTDAERNNACLSRLPGAKGNRKTKTVTFAKRPRCVGCGQHSPLVYLPQTIAGNRVGWCKSKQTCLDTSGIVTFEWNGNPIAITRESIQGLPPAAEAHQSDDSESESESESDSAPERTTANPEDFESASGSESESDSGSESESDKPIKPKLQENPKPLVKKPHVALVDFVSVRSSKPKQNSKASTSNSKPKSTPDSKPKHSKREREISDSDSDSDSEPKLHKKQKTNKNSADRNRGIIAALLANAPEVRLLLANKGTPVADKDFTAFLFASMASLFFYFFGFFCWGP